MSRLLSFGHGEDAPVVRGNQLKSVMKEAGLPQGFGKQKPRRKNFGRQRVEDEEKDEEEDSPEEKARLAALSAKFTPFVPVAIARAKELGAATAEEKAKAEAEAEEEGPPEEELTDLQKRLRDVRKKMHAVKQQSEKVRRHRGVGSDAVCVM